MVGAYSEWFGKRITIGESLWGISHSGELCVARLYGSFDDGQVLHYDGPKVALARTTDRPDELVGCTVTDGEHIYHISEVEFVVGLDGNVMVSYFLGIRDNEEEVSIGSKFTEVGDFNPLLGVACCALWSVPNLCSGTCSPTACVPPLCECTGTGGCIPIYQLVCRGYCQGGDPQCDPGDCTGDVNNCLCD
jgi:hypothetical protein